MKLGRFFVATTAVVAMTLLSAGGVGPAQAQQSSDATLSGLTLSAGTLSPAFASNTYRYGAFVGNSVSTVDVTATVNQSGATLTIYHGFSALAATSGVATPVALSEGHNQISISVTSQDGAITQGYIVFLYRGSTADYAWKVDDDIELHPDNDGPWSIWSDGTTMWVLDQGDDKLYAYTLSGGARDTSKEFDLHSENGSPWGIWSDGTTMWVADEGDRKLYAYTLSGGARDTTKEFDLYDDGFPHLPRGIWSDSTTMWVWEDSFDKLYSYTLSGGARDTSKEFDLHSENRYPRDIWSDGTTMWVADSDRFGAKLYAYTLSGGARDTSKEFDLHSENGSPRGIWSDGTTMWVLDAGDDRLYSYNMPGSASSLEAPTIGAVTPGTGSLAVSWTAPSSDGGSTITAYDLRHIQTSADETVDSNWTVVDDVWTTGGGTLQHTLTGLTGGTQYDLQIRAVNAEGDGPWSATATGTPTAVTTTIDYDTDDDGLIEVGSLAQLNAIRWDLDGNGTPASANTSDYSTAFPNAATGLGCPSSGCTGYELTSDIDLDVAPYNTGAGWEPIGTFGTSQDFTATFEGNDNTISGLFINRPTADFVGLFGGVGILGTGTIRNVGVTGVDVTGSGSAGGLVGWSRGTISACYATGAVSGSGDQVGGLAGYNGGTGTVTASYADVTVSGSQNNVGGLVGHNEGTGSITASYAIGDVSSAGDFVGGLVGANFSAIRASYATGTATGGSNAGGLIGGDVRGTITASYWDTQTSSLSTSAGGVGKTTSELQSPTSNTGIYATWDSGVWDFGTSSQYPALKGLGLSVAEQRQSHPAAVSSLGAPTIGTVTPGAGSFAVSWTAPSSDGGSAITAYDLRHIQTTADETVDSNWTVVDDVWTTGGGTLQHTLTGLTGGTQYDLQMRAVNAVGDGPWSATATGTPTTATDYDADDDGLIEITSAAQLNAVRYDLDGNGTPASANASDYSAAYPSAATGMGCPQAGCTGYELTSGIDLDVAPYNTGAGWEPIGTFGLSQEAFRATFDGNGNTIAGLFIDRSTSDYVGLFGGAGLYGTGTIRNVGLTGVDVKGRSQVGGLAGMEYGNDKRQPC